MKQCDVMEIEIQLSNQTNNNNDNFYQQTQQRQQLQFPHKLM